MPYDKNYLMAAAGRKQVPTNRKGGNDLTAAPKLKNLLEGPNDLSPGGGGPNLNTGLPNPQFPPYGGYGGHYRKYLKQLEKQRLAESGVVGGGGGFFGPLKRLRNTEGLGQIYDIISRRGATDPQRLNLELSDITRGTQAQQERNAGAASLVGGSGVLAALDAAIAAGGGETRARAIAQENALAEERQRQDILNLLLGPTERRSGRRAQLRAALAQRDAGQSGFDIGGLFDLLGPLLKGLGGGGGKGEPVYGGPDQEFGTPETGTYPDYSYVL